MARAGGAGRRVGVGHGITLSIACALFLAALQQLGIFAPLDLRLYDLRYWIRGERPADDSIALVVVDDATMVAFGNQPVPRDVFALLIGALERGGARAIGFDLQFLGPDPRGDENADALLAWVSGEHHNVVHSIYLYPEGQPHAAGTAIGEDEAAALRREGIPAGHLPIPRAGGAALPYTALLETAAALGHLSVAVDRDGTIRRVPPAIRHGDRAFVTLGLRLYGMAMGESSSPTLRARRGILEMAWKDRRLALPVDSEGAMAIDFAGDRRAFPRVHSMREVLAWDQLRDSLRLRAAFQGRIILVGSGTVAQVTTDLGATPFAPATPLVYVHANVLHTALAGRFLSPPPPGVYQAALVLLAVLLGWLFAVVPLGGAAAIAALWVVVGAAADWILFTRFGVVLAPTMWILFPPVAYVALESYRVLFYERRTREQERELRLARAIQVRLLPDAAPDWRSLDVDGCNLPAREVGGDYYDWVPLEDGQLVVGLGDVSGKGVAAALLMSHLHASLHGCVGNGVTMSGLARSMHLSLHRAIEPGRFATFFLASIDRDAPTLRFANAGHNPGLLVTRRGVEMLGATGLPLGILEGAEYTEEEREFGPGDVLVLYSDGVTECSLHTELYGEERLRDLVALLAGREVSAREMIEGILADVRRFSHGHTDSDDITILVVRRIQAGPLAPGYSPPPPK